MNLEWKSLAFLACFYLQSCDSIGALCCGFGGRFHYSFSLLAWIGFQTQSVSCCNSTVDCVVGIWFFFAWPAMKPGVLVRFFWEEQLSLTPVTQTCLQHCLIFVAKLDLKMVHDHLKIRSETEPIADHAGSPFTFFYESKNWDKMIPWRTLPKFSSEPLAVQIQRSVRWGELYLLVRQELSFRTLHKSLELSIPGKLVHDWNKPIPSIKMWTEN